MASRDDILNAVKRNQPTFVDLPDVSIFKGDTNNTGDRFTEILTAIGGKVVPVKSMGDIRGYIQHNMNNGSRNITTLPSLGDIMEYIHQKDIDPHTLQDVDNAVIQAHFGVAENGAVWVTEDMVALRALPFICQHLAVIVNVDNIVPTMHEAYACIGDTDYNFSTFIAGPSKTADIEQSLVLGAHGPRSMTIFLIDCK
jgi:L-lactate dehydrogenase complex protein LldG